jgi:hypothetical protein
MIDPVQASDTSKLCITFSVLERLRDTIGIRQPENGGVLGGSRSDGIVRLYYFDEFAARSGSTYSPNFRFLNRLFRERWNPAGIQLLGFVHSHPGGLIYPSSGDIEYARAIIENIPDLDQLLLPIATTIPDTGVFRIHPYAAVRKDDNVQIRELTLKVVPDKQVASGETR